MAKKASKGNLEGDVARLRAEVDGIDTALLMLLAKRKRLALEIGEAKRKAGVKDDKERVQEVLLKVQKTAKSMGLKEAEIKKIWEALLAYMLKEQIEKYH